MYIMCMKCIYIYIYIHTYIHTYIYLSLYIYIYTLIIIYYVYIYIMYISIYTHTNIHTFILRLRPGRRKALMALPRIAQREWAMRARGEYSHMYIRICMYTRTYDVYVCVCVPFSANKKGWSRHAAPCLVACRGVGF